MLTRGAPVEQIKTLEDENADLRAQLEAMRKDLTAARGELDRLSRENDALKRQVEGLETANAELNKQVPWSPPQHDVRHRMLGGLGLRSHVRR